MPSIVRALLALGLVLASIVAMPAQQRPTPRTFTTGTELVLVDFVVSDKADRPVSGLSATDFVVKEDGKERPIVSFEAFGGGSTPAPAGRNKEPVSPPHTALLPNASTVVLVDDGQLSPQQAARLRPSFKGLLARVAEPSGMLMLVAPGSGVSVAGSLPANAEAIASAADAIVGHRVEEQSNFPIADAEALDVARGELTPEQANAFARELANKGAHDARARRNAMYDAALLCLDWLTTRPGRHSLIVVSAGFSQDPDEAKYYDVVTRSLRANAPIHFLDARGLQGISL